jgi:phosphoribosyl 1,2-cyclic phosphodiesterase
MKITLWGTRGSLASPGPENLRYGGNTSCVEVRGVDDTILVLDAGTGIRRLGTALEPGVKRIDILLTHLHFDHIQGLGFFDPLYRPELEVHIWGPPSATLDLPSRLVRDFSTTLFPVRLGDLPSHPRLHDVPLEPFEIGGLTIAANFVCHPGPTFGYRITEGAASVAYLPDHEPALGAPDFPAEREWISGFELAEGADLLIHDAQYTAGEYLEHVGWGHSSLAHTLSFAGAVSAKRLVTFHHDPSHSDTMLDGAVDEARESCRFPFELVPGVEGATFQVAAPV